MLKRMAGGLVVALAVAGLVLAEDTRGTITKVSDDSITVRTGGFGKDNAQEKTFKVSKGVTVSRTAGKDKEEVKLTLDELKTAVKVTNVFATVTHEGDAASAIKIGGFGGGAGGGFGKKKKDN